MSTKILSAALITALQVAIKEVPISHDEAVLIREMTAGEREDYEKIFKVKETNQIRATLIAKSVCDESGALLFTDADIPALVKLPSSFTLKVYDAANELNGLKAAAVDKAEQD